VADQVLPPGRDEIVLASPQGQPPCQDREHRTSGRLAEVIVTFGQLADPGSYPYSPDALWPECWGRSFAMCGQCWKRTRQVARAARESVLIRDTTGPASG
jgi:hypothetical protein